MSKINGKSILYGVSVVVTLLTMIVGVVYGYGKMSEKQSGQEEKLTIVKNEGCLPSRLNRGSIRVIENQLKNIDNTLVDLNTQQTAGFKAVMEKLNKE